MSSIYDPIYLSDFYDRYGESEWYRFERSASHRINFEVHLHILRKYLHPEIEVLEIGPGPGRFTIPMAESGAKITLVDISKRQLDLNEERMRAAGLDQNVQSRLLGDIVDLSRFADNSFDLVTAYGGPLSYVYDKARLALSEMERVARPGGHVLFSVMSRWGSTRALLPLILPLIQEFGIEPIENILFSGDVHSQLKSEHRFHMYDLEELSAMLLQSKCEIVELSASGVISVQNDSALEGKWVDTSFWDRFISWEIEASKQNGLLEAGTHIIAALKKAKGLGEKT